MHLTLGTSRRRATPGSPSSINRATARILNSFEPDRTQSKPFHAVREAGTFRRYCRWWSGLLISLNRLSDDEDGSILQDQLLLNNRSLERLIRKMNQAAQALLAVNTDALDLDDCLRDSSLQLHAQDLCEHVRDLSTSLVRVNHEHSPFQAGVVAFSALKTLSSDGAWVGAHDYSGFLSGMIHCMQLWLLGHCVQRARQSPQDRCMQDIVRQECNEFLVNTTSTPVAELSFWRLLTWKARNDTVRHPVTTLNADCTQVS